MDLHEVKTRLQDHLSDGLVAVVGSGLSCAEGLPGMGELADHLSKNIGPGLAGDDLSIWEEIKTLLPSEGLEAALLLKSPPPILEGAIAASTAWLIGERERAVITEVFSGKVNANGVIDVPATLEVIRSAQCVLDDCQKSKAQEMP